MNEYILDTADILVRYPCKYPSDYTTITHLYRRHLACPIISHLKPSQDIILTSFLFFRKQAIVSYFFSHGNEVPMNLNRDLSHVANMIERYFLFYRQCLSRGR
jgi:hypothetical protein